MENENQEKHNETSAWFEEEVLPRYRGEAMRRQELHGNFLEDALQEEEGPGGTKHLSITYRWNVPIVEEDTPNHPGGSLLPSKESRYVPLRLPLEDKFLPDRPSDILFESTLAQMMFGQPLIPLDAAQLDQEVEWRQRVNKAFEEGNKEENE